MKTLQTAANNNAINNVKLVFKKSTVKKFAYLINEGKDEAVLEFLRSCVAVAHCKDSFAAVLVHSGQRYTSTGQIHNALRAYYQAKE
jgi:hypothetical protein